MTTDTPPPGPSGPSSAAFAGAAPPFPPGQPFPPGTYPPGTYAPGHPAPPAGYVPGGWDVLPPTPENAPALNDAAEYHSGHRLLRVSGISDIVLGGLCVGLAVLGYQLGVVSVLLTVFGVVLLVTGVWAVAAPSPRAMLVDGASMIILGGINLFLFAQNFLAGGLPRWWWVAIAGFLILGGVHRFSRYRRFKDASRTVPSRATLGWIDALWRMLKAAKPDRDPTMIRFDSLNAFPPVMCKAQLYPELAVCLVNKDRLRFVPRSQLRIEPVDPAAAVAPGGKALKARIVMADREFTGMVPADSLLRYRAWSGQPGTRPQADAPIVGHGG
jgi:hypothetical protein